MRVCVPLFCCAQARGSALAPAQKKAEMTLAFTQAQKALSMIKAHIPRLVTTGVVVANEPILYVDPPNVPPVMEFLKHLDEGACQGGGPLEGLLSPSTHTHPDGAPLSRDAVGM